MQINIKDLPLKFDFNRYDNSYELRNNKGILIKALRNDYVATRYLIDVLGIHKEAAEQIVARTYLTAIKNPRYERRR